MVCYDCLICFGGELIEYHSSHERRCCYDRSLIARYLLSSYCFFLLTSWLLEPSSPQVTDRCFESNGPDCFWLVVSQLYQRLPARLLTFYGPVKPFLTLGRSFASSPVAALQGLSLRWQKCHSHHWPILGVRPRDDDVN